MAANDLRMAEQEVARLTQLVSKRKERAAHAQTKLKLAKARLTTPKGRKKNGSK